MKWKHALAGLLAVGLGTPACLAADAPSADLVARGKYLSDAGDCVACHTKPGGEPFAGGRYLPTPFGAIGSPNITPDQDTGIGKITDDQFYRVLHEGIGAEGEYLYPAMPYPWYTKVTKDDALAIKAYLFTLKPVHSPALPNKMSFPFNIRTGLLAWNQAFFHEGTFEPDHSQSAEVNRGAYLVQGLGHCGACHNGRGTLGNGQIARPLQGGEIQDWYAPNLTADVHEGIGKYSEAQLVTYLKTGVAEGMGVAGGPMAETIHDSLSKLSDADLHAMVAYLKSTKPQASYVAVQRSDYAGPVPAGRETYLSYCSSCHQTNGHGIEGAVAPLVANGAVLAGGPQDVIRTVLGGIEAQKTEAPMPAVGQGMTDQEIADVTNYVRQAWGNTAPPNAGAGDVGKLRQSTFVALYGLPKGECPAIAKPEIAAAVADSKNSINAALQGVTQANIQQTAEQIVPKMKEAAPHAQQADIVNGLAMAFCPIVRKDPNMPEQGKPLAVGQFAVQVYSELRSNGKD